MRKICLLVLTSTLLIGCNKSNLNPAQQMGSINLNLEQGNTIFVNTKASQASDDYNVVITKSGESQATKSDTYGNLKGSSISLSPGAYSITADNISEQAAIQNRGAARYAKTQTFNVTAGNTTNVSLTCEMANSKVSFTFDQTFKDCFEMNNSTQAANVTAYETSNSGRVITFSKDATIDTEIAYFNIPSSGTPTLSYTITAYRNDGVLKTFTGSTTIAAKSWYKLTIKASSTNGQAGVSIEVDETVAEIANDIVVDPYSQN